MDKLDQEEKVFLGQYKLPTAYHELTASGDIPESYATKISEFQKKGAISNFTSALENIGAIRQNCEQMLADTEAILQEEENFDKGMRDAYKEQWCVLASPGLNQPYQARKLHRVASQPPRCKSDQLCSSSCDGVAV